MRDKDPLRRKVTELAKPRVRATGRTALRTGMKIARAAHAKARELDEQYELSDGAKIRKREERERKGEAVAHKAHDDHRRFLENLSERSGFSVDKHALRKQATEPWTTIELGPGDRPVGMNRKFSGDSKYIGIDPHIHMPREVTEEIFARLKSSRPGENINLLSLDRGAKSIAGEIPDGSADEVFAVYVFDDPKTDRGTIISEAYRMLKPGGIFIVSDHKSLLSRLKPKYSSPIDRPEFERKGVAADLETAGFELQFYREYPGSYWTALEEGSPELAELQGKYFDIGNKLGLVSEYNQPHMDILVAMKPPEPTYTARA